MKISILSSIITTALLLYRAICQNLLTLQSFGILSLDNTFVEEFVIEGKRANSDIYAVSKTDVIKIQRKQKHLTDVLFVYVFPSSIKRIQEM